MVEDGVIYQIYPRSFQDTNGDGMGDLNGIRARLDYLSELGVDAIWISPFYKSPMADCGYDVLDYYNVDPLFGTMRDFEVLIEETHARRGDACAWAEAHPRFRAEPHIGSAPMVPGEPLLASEREARLVHLAGRWTRGRHSEQLAQQFRQERLGMGRGHRSILLPRLFEGAARPQLAQSRSAGGDVRGDAVLAAASGSTCCGI
jgi:hypothetical protein